MKHYWWKILGIILVCYSIVAGFYINVPDLPLIEQTIRNMFFHVPMWFTMMLIFMISFNFSILNLFSRKEKNEIIANEAVNVGLLFGVLGIITGTIWAKFTWGSWWLKDPKLNGALVSVMIYLIYPVLGTSFEGRQRMIILSAYNIMAFVMMFFLVMIYPRIGGSSIHPGQGSNPALVMGDIDSAMRMIFFSAVAGWFLIGAWILSLRVRMKRLE